MTKPHWDRQKMRLHALSGSARLCIPSASTNLPVHALVPATQGRSTTHFLCFTCTCFCAPNAQTTSRIAGTGNHKGLRGHHGLHARYFVPCQSSIPRLPQSRAHTHPHKAQASTDS
eukprot:scaffold284912_cov15-Tisochrysis_lutea.AAC.1